MLFCVIIKKVPQSCKISRDSCLMILNHFLWFYCNPEPLYFSQILFQTIRHWSKVSLLLIFFRYPTYSGGDLVAKSYLTLASPWTVGCQAPLPMGFSRQEYWSGLPFPTPRNPPHWNPFWLSQGCTTRTDPESAGETRKLLPSTSNSRRWATWQAAWVATRLLSPWGTPSQ